MNLIALERYCSKPLRGAKTSSNHLQVQVKRKIHREREFINQAKRYIPLSTLVSDVVLNRSADLSLVHEGSVDVLVQESSL